MKRPATYKLGDSSRYFSGTCVLRELQKDSDGLRVTAKEAMGKAGERQVKNCRYVYQNTMGGSGFNNIATIWGWEI